MVAVTKAWLRMVFVSLCILFCLEISISAQQSKQDWDGDDASPGHKDKFFSDLKVTRQRRSKKSNSDTIMTVAKAAYGDIGKSRNGKKTNPDTLMTVAKAAYGGGGKSRNGKKTDPDTLMTAAKAAYGDSG